MPARPRTQVVRVVGDEGSLMLDSLLAAYRAKNRKSFELFVQAQEFLPGGNTRTTQFHAPFPCYASHGEGKYLIDVDGNRRLDFANNMGAMVLGHADPDVVRALQEQAARGTSWAAPSGLEIIWAELLTQRLPAVDTVRFTNSGTEAAMFAIRGAKAYTGKRKVAKFEGGMHGSHDYGQFSVRPLDSLLSGPRHRPVPFPQMSGLSEGIRGELVILPFNDLDQTSDLIQEHKDDLACVIVEPVLGVAGMIPAAPGFLKGLRRVTTESDVLLIFDEVLTFPISMGGAQEHYDVYPDLTVLGKVIGGGLPVGAFGGRKETMAVYDPSKGPPTVMHSGTFAGNPLTAAAGIATLRKLDAGAIAHLNRLGDRVRRELNRVFAEPGIPACVTGLGSLFHVHFVAQPPMCYRDTLQNDEHMLRAFFFWLFNNDVYVVPRGMASLSLPMDDQDVDRLVALVAEFGDQLAREPKGVRSGASR